jgi:putative ABC transport system permease protein
MIKNYLKIAWRNLVKNKASSVINIGGLAVGMAVAMLIFLWIWDELSFNKFHQNYEHIAQVKQNVTNNGAVQTLSDVPYPLGNELRKNYGSDFKNVVLSWGYWDHILTSGDKKFTKKGIYFEPQGPQMLTLKMLEGTWDGLKDPSSICFLNRYLTHFLEMPAR